MNRMEKNLRPILVLAYADSAHAAQCGRHFRRMGWEVHLVASATEARRLLDHVQPRVIVLDTELPDESGWLLCAKVTQENPNRQVVLVAPERTPASAEQATRVGAVAIVTRSEPVDALVESVLGQALTEAV